MKLYPHIISQHIQVGYFSPEGFIKVMERSSVQILNVMFLVSTTYVVLGQLEITIHPVENCECHPVFLPQDL